MPSIWYCAISTDLLLVAIPVALIWFLVMVALSQRLARYTSLWGIAAAQLVWLALAIGAVVAISTLGGGPHVECLQPIQGLEDGWTIYPPLP